MRIELESVCQLVGETVNPLRHSSEVFAHYSIPAYDAGQGPVLEPGASILSNKIEFPAGSILVSKLNPRISRVWLVTDNRVQRRFLIEAFKHMGGRLGERATGADVTAMGSSRLYGREKENLIFPIALANLALHGIDSPNLWHGNTLAGREEYGGLWHDAPALFDVVLTNPPFGGQENADVQTGFAYRTSATQILFLQHVIDSLTATGRCGMVVDEGVMFRTNENAFVQTKRKLLDACDLWAVVSLPSGTFTATGAGVKTNLLFFTKGKRTERTWYYDLSDVKVTKKKPLTLAAFEDFFRFLPGREESERSWTVERAEIEKRNYDLKAVNPNRKHVADERTPIEIIEEIERHGAEVARSAQALRQLLAGHARN